MSDLYTGSLRGRRMSTIDRLKELEAKATPGPWAYRDSDESIRAITPERPNGIKLFDAMTADLQHDFKERYWSDAVLTVEMRNALAKFLAFVDAFDKMAEWQDISTAITKDVFIARAALDEEPK